MAFLVKCLSLRQPWATLLAIGAKKLETRSWATKHRGTFAIHAAKTFDEAAKDLCRLEPFQSTLASAGYHSWSDLPLGAVIGQAELIACRRVEDTNPPPPGSLEEAFGDFRQGRWVWEIANAKEYVPFYCPGKVGFFAVDMEDRARPKDPEVRQNA